MTLKVDLDHLVIAAADLSSGVAYVRELLGVEMPFGGEHEKISTHNHLMRLGSNVFLEIIAISPSAKQPDRPRWYGLDDPYLNAVIARQPQLIAWVVNTNDITRLLNQANFPFGQTEKISRGSLDWLFALPEDGRLHGSGLIPYLMQWNTKAHPALTMADLGCRLKSLTLYSPNPSWLESVLKQINATEMVTVNELADNRTAYMTAMIETATGLKELSSRI